MSTTYDKITAFHSAAYRPGLHETILHNCLGNKKFERGLDIGCGTGVSTIALRNFCNDVIGVDPNEKMLSQAVPKDNLNYQLMVGNKLPFANNSFDICTYAGAWWYGKSQALLDETLRVSTKNGAILLYDFEVDLSTFYNRMDLVPADLKGYDHSSNFEGLATAKVTATSKKTDRKQLLLSPSELAHLLCSEQQIYNQLAQRFSNDDAFNHLLQYIIKYFGQSNIPITAVTYYTHYKL
jgi:ubiquinone/menaquinone biosynthesis C-methylase UbiE